MMMTIKRMFMHYVLRRWMIWHTGHGAYFRPNARGYTHDAHKAGWFTEKETKQWEYHSYSLVRRY